MLQIFLIFAKFYDVVYSWIASGESSVIVYVSCLYLYFGGHVLCSHICLNLRQSYLLLS